MQQGQQDPSRSRCWYSAVISPFPLWQLFWTSFLNECRKHWLHRDCIYIYIHACVKPQHWTNPTYPHTGTTLRRRSCYHTVHTAVQTAVDWITGGRGGTITVTDKFLIRIHRVSATKTAYQIWSQERVWEQSEQRCAASGLEVLGSEETIRQRFESQMFFPSCSLQDSSCSTVQEFIYLCVCFQEVTGAVCRPV